MTLTVRNLSKVFPHPDGDVHALHELSFTLQKGCFASITGSSGSGKTTLLLTLSGLLKASSGEIYFDDFRIDNARDSQLAEFRNRNVGFVMQNFALIPYITAIENVMLPLATSRLPRKEKVERAGQIIEMVGLTNRRNHFPRELSAGQQQRIAMARALINSPSIVMADEPTGNLDPALSVEILNLLGDINQKLNITILMVTHSPAAAEYGNFRLHLHEGKQMLQ